MGIMTGFWLDYNACRSISQFGQRSERQELCEIPLCVGVVVRTGFWPEIGKKHADRTNDGGQLRCEVAKLPQKQSVVLEKQRETQSAVGNRSH